MRQPLSERERTAVELAATLADVFAARAAEHDRERTFPFEREAGEQLPAPEFVS